MGLGLRVLDLGLDVKGLVNKRTAAPLARTSITRLPWNPNFGG